MLIKSHNTTIFDLTDGAYWHSEFLPIGQRSPQNMLLHESAFPDLTKPDIIAEIT